MRNVIVTGGSRGLGLGIVRRLAQEGYCVLAIARKQTAEITELAQCHPTGRVHFEAFDLADLDGIAELVKTLRKEYGAIYGLINNAGTSAEGTLAMMPIAQIEQVVRLNTLSPIVMAKSVVRAMMADGGGRIVNIASIVASAGYSGLAVYSASKASMVGFTRSLSREVGRLGITVNAVAPGFVDTDMTRGLTCEQREQIMRRSALKRLVEVDDVAGSVAFFLGESAKNITGTVMTVDAGATA